MRRSVIFFAFLLALLGSLGYASASRAAPPQQAPACRFFTETGGGQGGFNVCDDGQAKFLSAFNQWGLQRIGYPVSQRYNRDGFVTQAFQKAIMQWRPDGSYVALVNIFDDLHNDGFDDRLLTTRQTPNQLPAGWDGISDWNTIVQKRQALLDTRPALRTTYFSVNNPILFFGLPTSEVQDMGNHYAIRLQRAVLQEWKEDVPWAKKGQVTIANGGDIAKELGGLPAAAIVPEPGGTVPTPPPGTTPTPPPTSSVTGRILVTSNEGNLKNRLFIMNADGSGRRQLTAIDNCYNARFTASGTEVVFDHFDRQYDLFRVSTEGGSVISLTNTNHTTERYPAVAPDGTIAYVQAGRNGDGMYTIDTYGGNRQLVTNALRGYPTSWSPDSQWIAFVGLTGGIPDIWIIRRDGTDMRQLTTLGRVQAIVSPTFSPDGSQIAFTTRSIDSAWQIWTVTLATGEIKYVRDAIDNNPESDVTIAAWRNGHFLMGGYTNGQWDPYFVPVTGGSVTRIWASDKDDIPTDWWP